MSENKIKHTTKANVFEDLFSDKKNLLELYRLLHPEDTDTKESDLEILSIQNIVTYGQYNDLGFKKGNRWMILVEHQSTWSVNILLRCIMYLAETWRRYLKETKQSLYSTKPVKIPETELYVLYTGSEEKPHEITLAKEFFHGKDSAIKAKIQILQHEGNHSIVDQYIDFCKIYDDYRKKNLDNPRKGATGAIDECIRKGILPEYLKKQREEVVDVMLTLYSQEEVNEMERESVAREALEEGEQRGTIRGSVMMAKKFGQTLDQTVQSVAECFGYSEAESRKQVLQYWK